MASSRTVTFAALLALACPAAHAQLYEFKDAELPASRSLHVMQFFHIFSEEEAPGAGGSFEPAKVTFTGFVGRSTLPSLRDADVGKYQGIQVSVMPFRARLSKIISSGQFCSAAEQLAALPSGRDDTHSQAVRLGHAPAGEVRAELREGGVYMLVLSNCGDLQNMTVSGSVLVRNSYGLLPGSEYYKMPFFGWLAVVYAVLLAVWAVLLVWKYQELVFLHYYVLGLALVGLLETAAWWLTLNTWNTTGSKQQDLSSAAVVLSAMKVCIAYTFILALSSGWGVTTQILERSTKRKIEGLIFFYVIAYYARETVLSLRHSHNLPAMRVVGYLLPAALLNALIFTCIFSSLKSLIETLKERCDDEAVRLFRSSRAVLRGAIMVACQAFVFQVLEIFRIFSVPWRYSWVLSDAASHVVFVVTLGVFMLKWKPDKGLRKHSRPPGAPRGESAEGGRTTGALDPGALPDDDDIETMGLMQVHGGPPEQGSAAPAVIGRFDDSE